MAGKCCIAPLQSSIHTTRPGIVFAPSHADCCDFEYFILIESSGLLGHIRSLSGGGGECLSSRAKERVEGAVVESDQGVLEATHSMLKDASHAIL